jgi:mycofactocin system glycosyltransferase
LTAPDPAPLGATLVADGGTSSYDDGRLLVGGSPPRALRLTDDGAARARALLAGVPVTDAVGAALARRLLDGGLAHPAPTTPARYDGQLDVVVPAYGAGRLAGCLAALGAGRSLPVTVVDDGSPEPAGLLAAIECAGAKVLRLLENRGPAAARNAGLAATTAPIVAFVDSDVEVSVETLQGLAALLDDPAVAAVAPRIRPAGSTAPTAAGSRLDLGDRAGVVRPGSRVSYVPSTVLVVRRAAVEAVGGFDETMRVGEDVDLVWRLAAAGWTVRYAPGFVARHHEPATWPAALDRSRRYGGATGPLARRHPGAGAAALSPPFAPTVAVLLAVLGRPRTAVAVLGACAAGPYRRLRAVGVPDRDAASIATTSTARATAYSARWLVQVWSPLLFLAGVRMWRRRDLGSGLILAAVAARPLRTVDDVAYGIGVWTGCVRARAFGPLGPRR